MATKKQTTSKSPKQRKPKEEQFSVSQLKDEVSAFDEFIQVPVTSNGKEYIIKLWPFFSPTRIRDVVEEIAEFFKKAGDEKLKIPQSEEDDIVGYFVSKAFTNMAFTKSKKAKNIYDEFKLALNSPTFKTIVKAFPKESMQSIYERIFEVLEMNTSLKNQFKAAREMINSLPPENRNIVEKMFLNDGSEKVDAENVED